MSQKCVDYALNYIYRFPKSEKELRVQLLKKWFSEAEIDFTINYLKQQNFVNDENFARMYIESEVSKKWKPIIVVKQKLLQKGIDKNSIDKVLVSQNEDIQYWIWKKIDKEMEKLKQKWLSWFDIIQKLMGKGYRLDDIKKVIRSNEIDR